MRIARESQRLILLVFVRASTAAESAAAGARDDKSALAAAGPGGAIHKGSGSNSAQQIGAGTKVRGMDAENTPPEEAKAGKPDVSSETTQGSLFDAVCSSIMNSDAQPLSVACASGGRLSTHAHE